MRLFIKSATELEFLMFEDREFHSTGMALEKADSLNRFYEDGVRSTESYP